MGDGDYKFNQYSLEQGPDRVKACDNLNVSNKYLNLFTVESPLTETVDDAPNEVEGNIDESKLGNSQNDNDN